MNKLHRVEPVEDKVQFIQLAQRLEVKYSQLGGGDIWHLMSAIQLQSDCPRIALFSFDADLVSAAKAEGIQAVCGKGLDPDRVVAVLKASGKFLGN